MKKISNPPNPFESQVRELLEAPSEAKLEIFEDASRSILSRNDSPDLNFRWGVNPYRGCFHSCSYCYAREYHEYLGMGAGTDFESKIVIKPKAAELLREEFMKKKWVGEPVVFSGATDCYQPIEAVYKLTQSCLKVCLEFKNPVGIITKSFLITRDLDLLADLHREAFVMVAMSIPFFSDEMGKKMEPQASSITRRFLAVEALAKRGIPVGISLAPTIPGLNENDIPNIMKKAQDCGARFAFHSLVHLSKSVLPVFEEKIKAALPEERVTRIMNRLHETREGNISESRVGHRMSGQGVYWKSISDLFRMSLKKYNLDQPVPWPEISPFKRPRPQLELNL